MIALFLNLKPVSRPKHKHPMNPKTFAMYQIGAGLVFIPIGVFFTYMGIIGQPISQTLGINGTFGLGGLAAGIGFFRLFRGIVAFRRLKNPN
jgi:hypothetical protein